MPTETLILGLIVVAISLFIVFARVPAFAVLFSLLVGFVLSSQASGDIYSFLASLTGFATYQQVQVAILLIPFVLTVIFLKGRVHKTMFITEILPAVGASLVLLILLYPYVDFVHNLIDIASSDNLDQYKSPILIIASALGLVSIWMNHPKSAHHKGKHKH